MRLETPFYKLPLRVDVEQLVNEVNGFAEDEWRAHPQQFEGNSSMILVSANGQINDDMHGPMLPTEKLNRCLYIKQILASFNTVIGRSRLMRLSPKATVPIHTDINYYWRDRFRIHVPIVTDPSIRFCCNGNEVNMAAGEVWVFDNWHNHTVINDSDVTRIHLVADTTGTSAFWNLMAQSERPFDKINSVQSKPHMFAFDPDASLVLKTELHNASVVMHPGELELLVREIADDMFESTSGSQIGKVEFKGLLDALVYDWRSIWSIHSDNESGWAEYQSLRADILKRVSSINEPLPVASNGMPAVTILNSRLGAALNLQLKSNAQTQTPITGQALPTNTKKKISSSFDRPIFIVAGPRSGSTLLFETLARNRELWSIGGESHQLIESIDALNPATHGFYSNELKAADASDEVIMSLRQAFLSQLLDTNGRLLSGYAASERPEKLRFLEKTPKNALRIPFIKAVFPDAMFIFLHRRPRENISSIIDAWRSGKFITYKGLPDWQGKAWSLLLPPGWRELNGAPLEKIAAFQWHSANQQILNELTQLNDKDWTSVSYETFLDDPVETAKKLCTFADIPFGPRMQALADDQLPESRHTLTTPDPDKWRKNEREIMAVIADVEPLAKQLMSLNN